MYKERYNRHVFMLIAVHVYVSSGTYKDGKYKYSIVMPIAPEKAIEKAYENFDKDGYGEKVGAVRAVTHSLRSILDYFGSSADIVIFHCLDKDRHIKDWDVEETDSALAKGYKRDLEICRKIYKINFEVEESESANSWMQKACEMVSEANAS